jgi:pyruvate-formate lyase-activating enzyme
MKSEKTKIKRFIDLYVPTSTCNLRCHYCYVTHHELHNKDKELSYSSKTIRESLSKSRLGGTCLINICANGETLIPKKIINYIRVLLEEGHYVMVVTNGTLEKRFDEISKFPEEFFSKLFFKFSYQYLELKSKGLLDIFFNNIIKMKDLGCSFTLEVTPSDEFMPYVEEAEILAIKKIGSTFHVTIARDERVCGKLPILTNMSEKDYYKFWDKIGSSLFDYKKQIFGIKRKEFCYAGSWSAVIDISTGTMRQCYSSCYQQNIFDNLNKSIRFLPVGNNCPEAHCYNGHSFIALV